MNLKEIAICTSLLVPTAVPAIQAQKNYTWESLGKVFDITGIPDNQPYKSNTYELQNPIPNDIEIVNDSISKIFAKSMIKYFKNEIKAYSFSAQEEAKLQKDIETYFSTHNIFQIDWNKILLNLSEQSINNIFKHFIPHFEKKLSWIQRFWLHLLWEETVWNYTKKHYFTKAKWKDAEIAYKDIMIILSYATEWFRELRWNADMTIWYWYSTILKVLPNEYIKSKTSSRSSNYKNKSIRYIKTETPH